jgi:hypothetical protein
MKPFDNNVLFKKTIWTDEQLSAEIDLLKKAIYVLEKMGDRYDLVVSDMRTHLTFRLAIKLQRNQRDLDPAR